MIGKIFWTAGTIIIDGDELITYKTDDSDILYIKMKQQHKDGKHIFVTVESYRKTI